MGFADYNDTFTGADGSAINSDLWTVVGSPDIQGNAAELTIGESIASKWTFSGDFDVQVDFALQSPPAANSFYCALKFTIDATHGIYIAAARYSNAKYWQLGSINGGSWAYVGVARTSDSGKLRLRRIGNQISAYIADGTNETAAISTAKTVGTAGDDGTIVLAPAQWDTNPSITVRHDNFTIVSDGSVPAYSPDANDVLTGGTASAISYYSSTYEPSNGCNDNDSPWASASIAHTPAWWQYDLGDGVSKTVNILRIRSNVTAGSIATSFILYGSNDGSFGGEETNIFSASGLFWIPSETKEWSFSNSNGYRYYRVVFGGLVNYHYHEVAEFEMLEGVENYTDGSCSGGIVFGGEVVEIIMSNHLDGAAYGGIVFGSSGDLSTPENNQIDGAAFGGIVFGGEIAEQWSTEPNNSVAVKGGLYRISGVLYTLANTMSIAGLGSIAALVNCGTPPAVAGTYRYDLLSIDTAGDITVTAGTAATVPVMPTTPVSSVKLNHVLRYYGQTSIIQSDIGKTWLAPALATIDATIADDELAWGELSTTITITCRDQYGQLFTGNKTVSVEFLSGNGTIDPLLKSGTSSSFVFTYTRGTASPMLSFSSPTGAACIAFIMLLDAGGAIMT